MKDYDLNIHHHSENPNIVVDALSGKSTLDLSFLITNHEALLTDLRSLRIGVHIYNEGRIIVNLQVHIMSDKKSEIAHVNDP